MRPGKRFSLGWNVKRNFLRQLTASVFFDCRADGHSRHSYVHGVVCWRAFYLLLFTIDPIKGSALDVYQTKINAIPDDFSRTPPLRARNSRTFTAALNQLNQYAQPYGCTTSVRWQRTSARSPPPVVDLKTAGLLDPRVIAKPRGLCQGSSADQALKQRCTSFLRPSAAGKVNLPGPGTRLSTLVLAVR